MAWRMASQRASVVGAEALALDEGDVAMAERVEVIDGEGGGAVVIEDDVGYAFGLVMA